MLRPIARRRTTGRSHRRAQSERDPDESGKLRRVQNITRERPRAWLRNVGVQNSGRLQGSRRDTRTSWPRPLGTESDVTTTIAQEEMSDRKEARWAFERAGTIHRTRRGFVDPKPEAVEGGQIDQERGGKPSFAGQRTRGRERSVRL